MRDGDSKPGFISESISSGRATGRAPRQRARLPRSVSKKGCVRLFVSSGGEGDEVVKSEVVAEMMK